MAARSRAAPSMRSSQTEKPTPGIGDLRAEQGQQPVVAAAADKRPGGIAGGNLEDQAGVIIERAAEGGVVADLFRPAGRAPRPPRRGRRNSCSAAPSDRPAEAANSCSALRRAVERHVDGEKCFQRRKASADRRTLRSSAFSTSRRAISCGVRPDVGDRPASAMPAEIWAASLLEIAIGDERRHRLGQRAVLRRAGEVGKGRGQHFGRAEGAGKPHAPAARQAECGQHRLEDGLVAERDLLGMAGQCERQQRMGVGYASGRRLRPCSSSPRSSMPAWKNSLPPSRRWRNTSPR